MPYQPCGGWQLRLKVGLSIAAVVAAVAVTTPSQGGRDASSAGGLNVDMAALAAESDGKHWPSYGRTFSENHYSPLDQVNAGTIGRLGLVWSVDLDVNQRADAQPLEAGGVIFTAAGLSIVQAFDAATGKLIWRFDPKVAEVAGAKLRSGWGIRGLALWGGRVYVGTQDGRLIALDGKTGKPAWSVMAVDQAEATITGAPRVFNGKVIIGFAGADRSNVRGAVSCYDADDGRLLWRFHTVPGDPSQGFENSSMEMAAKTWTGEWWKFGGGGTVWNAMTYDPDFNRVYIGTGNGGPWNWKIRNPGAGDNLFLASIVALDADTGEYVWHYQQNPNEAWDYNSTMDIELATLPIEGRDRKVLMHAPKNGFFYLIDRQTGKLISAEKIGKATWADRIDVTSGRPIDVPGSRYEHKPTLVWPGSYGTHNWQPMAFSPKAKLAYIPTIHQADAYGSVGIDPKSWTPKKLAWNSGISAPGIVRPTDEFSSSLLAWDPVKQREAWRVPTPGNINGGTMATGGGLVFQGHADGTFNAYDGATGRKLWSFSAGVAVMGAPISYSVNGRQYVTVMAGPISGAPAATLPDMAKFGWRYRDHPRRLLTFALDGQAKLPPTPPPGAEKPLVDNSFVVDPALARAGAPLYQSNCMSCHGWGAVALGAAPDLRASAVPLSAEAFEAVVSQGGLLAGGMPAFDELRPRELEAIRHYLRARASGVEVIGTAMIGSP